MFNFGSFLYRQFRLEVREYTTRENIRKMLVDFRQILTELYSSYCMIYNVQSLN